MENRLISVTPVGGTATTFAYDASGQRVMTVEPAGKTTHFPFPGYAEEMVGTTVTARRVTYTIAGQAVASRVQTFSPTAGNTLYRLYTDHLGSTVTQSTLSGGTVVGASTYYLPYGSYRGTPPTQTLTDRDFTGQRENRELGLLYYNARFYHPASGRFISPDTIVPDPANPQQLNRYTYVLGNPVNYRDSSGNCIFAVVDTIACIAIASKVIDYGLTVWDSYQAGQVLADPNASQGDKLMAGLTVGLAVLFEAVEPDDILPIGLPADDVARRTLLNGAQEALEEGGPEALEGFIRNNLGDYADDAIKKMDEVLGLDPRSLYDATQVPAGKNNLTAAGRALQKHANRPGDIWAKYLPEGTLNPANYNTAAGELVQDILTNPNTTRSYHKDFIQYFAPDGRGLRFNLDGSFVGFINP